MEVSRLTASDVSLATVELGAIYRTGAIDPNGLQRALRNSDFVLLLGRRGGEAAGYLHGAFIDRVDGRRMLMVYDLEVAAAHRRHGVGTALMHEARRLARDHDAIDTWLITEEDNDGAVALYEALGGTRFSSVGFEWSEQ